MLWCRANKRNITLGMNDLTHPVTCYHRNISIRVRQSTRDLVLFVSWIAHPTLRSTRSATERPKRWYFARWS